MVRGSTSASISIVFEDSVGDQSGPVHSQVRTANDSISDEAELPLPLNDVWISPHDIKSYPGIGLIQSHAVSYKSQEPQEQQGPPTLADFSVRLLIFVMWKETSTMFYMIEFKFLEELNV